MSISPPETAFRMRRRGWFASAVAAAAVLVPSLAEAETPPNALVMAWNIDAISTFDPAQVGEVVTNEILQNTCDPLVEHDPADEANMVPRLAESWDVSDDLMEITFHLREDAVFPSGNPVTAHDTEWSIERVVKLGFGNAATLTEYGFLEDTIEDQVEATDDHTLVMRLDKPYPTNLFLAAIAANRVTMTLDRETVIANEAEGDLGNNYLLTRTECVGPYRLAQWESGEVVVLEANEDHWGEQPNLERVLIRHVAEPGTQRLLLEQGDVDIARDLNVEDLAALDENPDIEIVRTLRPQLFYWAFNNGVEPFDDPRVRLAMRYLIDYDALAETIMAYNGVPRASFVQIGAFGALDEEEGQPFSLDIERARELLAEAGYEDGFETTLFIGTAPYGPPVAQHAQANAAEVGVTIEIERMASAQLFSRLRGREFETAMLGWQTGVPDAHGMASRHIYNPDNALEAGNSMFPSWRESFYSAELNERVDEALLEPDPERRAELYRDLQRDMLQEGPVAYMFQMYNIAATRPELQDWTWNGLQIYYRFASK